MSADLWTWCEWTPDIAARELLTGPGGIDNATHWELATKIREAIIHGSLSAERRAKKVWFIDHHEELTDHYSAPAEVIRWAIHAGVDVPQPYLDWYRTNATQASTPQASPARDESQGKPPNIVKRAVLIARLEPYMKEEGKLKWLLSNYHTNGLNACRTNDGWDFAEVARWLLKNDKLKPEISEEPIKTRIEQAVNNS